MSSPAGARPLSNSRHVAAPDDDAPEIFEGTVAFIAEHTPDPAEKRV